MISGAMGKRVMKVIVSVLLLLLTTRLLVGAVGSTPSSVTTLSMRPLLREAGESNVVSHRRFLLTTRDAPIGFPPPPAMQSPSPPGY